MKERRSDRHGVYMAAGRKTCRAREEPEEGEEVEQSKPTQK